MPSESKKPKKSNSFYQVIFLHQNESFRNYLKESPQVFTGQNKTARATCAAERFIIMKPLVLKIVDFVNYLYFYDMNQFVKDIRAFNRFYTDIIGLLDHHVLNSRYSLPEVRVMYEIYYHGAITANDISRLIRIDKGYLSRILLKFQQEKLISKKKSPTDGRSVILGLTKKGSNEFEKLDLAAGNQVKEILEQLPKETHNELVSHMNAIIKILQPYNFQQ